MEGPHPHVTSGLCERHPGKLTGTSSCVGRSQAGGKKCPPEGSGQAGEVEQCETPEVQQSKMPGPKPGLEQSQAHPQVGWRSDLEQNV